MIAAGEEAEGFFKALRRFAQPLAIWVFPDGLDHLADVTRDGVRAKFFAVDSIIQQDLFRWLGHEWLPSVFPAYSKLLLPVSWMRTRSSLAWGKFCRRQKISMHRFSVVGTFSRNAATSSLSER